MDSEVLQYLQYLESLGKPKGAHAYKYAIAGFEKWIMKQGRQFSSMTPNDVTFYMNTLESTKSANLFRGAILSFLKYRIGSMQMGDPLYMQEVQRITQMKMVPNRRKIREFQKIALTPQELSVLLTKIRKNFGDPIHSMAMLLAYCGARPGEIEGFSPDGIKWYSLKTAKINWSKRTALITTEKTLSQRLLVWCPQMDRYVRTVHESLPCKYPGRNLTLHLYRWQKNGANMVGGIKTTSKTFRRTFETNQRLLNAPQMLIDHTLGHTNGAISEIYTDYTAYEPQLRDMMEKQHYMIVNGIL